MAKKKSRAAPADEEAGAEATGNGADALTGGWYFRGKNYDPKKKGDQAAARKIFETGGALAPSGVKEPDERQAAHEAELQRLADAKVLKGYGTTEPEEESEEGS